MQERPQRLRRCQLSVPGSSEKMMQKAAGMGVDFVFLDLEDAVAPSEKRPARAKIVHALNGLDWGRTTRCVRINDLTTEYAYEDIIEVVEGARDNLDVIMLPKAMSAADVQFVDKLLSMMDGSSTACWQIQPAREPSGSGLSLASLLSHAIEFCHRQDVVPSSSPLSSASKPYRDNVIIGGDVEVAGLAT